MHDFLKDFMHESCAKISSPEANQAFLCGAKNNDPSPPPTPARNTKALRRKKAMTTVAKKKRAQQEAGDEQWAKKMPKITAALEVRDQKSAVGRGLYVSKQFKSGFEAGDAIGEYVGERIVEHEYQARIERYVIDKEFNYIVGVDTEDATGLYIDATKKGNWTRFVNNSHNPNAQFEPVVLNNQWHIFLVATERIKPGVEITIDYGAEYRSPDQKFVECFCTCKTCSGVIGVPLEKKAIKKLLLHDIHYQDDDLNVLCAENRLLEAENQQLKNQINRMRETLLAQVKGILDDVFIPLSDHRSDEVRDANKRIVHDLLNQNMIDAAPAAPSIEAAEPMPSTSKQVAKVQNSSRRSHNKRAASDSEDLEESEQSVTPLHAKKKRKSPRHPISPPVQLNNESSVSNNSLEETVASTSAAAAPTPPPSASNPSISSRRCPSIELDDGSDDDIIIIDSPVRALLPPPSRSLVSLTPPKTTPVKPVCVKSEPNAPRRVIDQVIEWYSKVRLKANDLTPCPIPLHDKNFRNLHEIRKHFFMSHPGAANGLHKQLLKSNQSYTDIEMQLYQEMLARKQLPQK